MTIILYMQGKRHQLDCALPNDLLAKKEQFLFYEGRQPIAASIKECLPALISTIVVPSPSTALKIPLDVMLQFIRHLIHHYTRR